MAIAPLVTIWAGLDHPERAILVLAVVVAFFPIFSGALTGLKSADADLERLFEWLKAGKISVPIRATFRLEEIQKAHREYARSARMGSIVIEISE